MDLQRLRSKYRAGAVLFSHVVCLAAACLGGQAFAGGTQVEAHELKGEPLATQGTVVRAERGILRCANKTRRRHGLAQLRVEPALGRAARLHARNMLRHGFFDHTDPWGRTSEDRVAKFDSRPWWVGENIAAAYGSPSSACRGWFRSRGHRENLLYPAYTHIGAGFAKGRRGYRRYYVQILATLYSEEAW